MDNQECIFAVVFVICITILLGITVPHCSDKTKQTVLECIKSGQPVAACHEAIHD